MHMQPTRDNIANDFSVEVNFTGAALDPDRITEITGLAPLKSAKTGDARQNSDSVCEEGFWSYETSSHDDVNECRDHQLICLVDKLEPHVAELHAAGVERIYFYYTLSSFVGLMNIRFKAETMEKLGRINADLYVSCFDCFNPNHSIWQDDEAMADASANGKNS